MNTALETGRDLFLTGLAMLADPRQVYDNGPDEIKTTRHPHHRLQATPAPA
jgi:hypothetical protein